MKLQHEPHKGYVAHEEFGLIVFYRTTSTEATGVNDKGKEVRSGTRMNRVCTSTGDYEEACKQLDRRLRTPVKEKEAKAGPNQHKMF